MTKKACIQTAGKSDSNRIPCQIRFVVPSVHTFLARVRLGCGSVEASSRGGVVSLRHHTCGSSCDTWPEASLELSRYLPTHADEPIRILLLYRDCSFLLLLSALLHRSSTPLIAPLVALHRATSGTVKTCSH